jgi:hypothetical protein
MGFQKPSLDKASWDIRRALTEIASPLNDGFTASHCKKELYLLKCWLDDEYEKLPTFVGEEQWEQERLIKILKKQHI